MRAVACLVCFALLLPGCGQNQGPRGDNRNQDRPRITPLEQPAPKADGKDKKDAKDKKEAEKKDAKDDKGKKEKDKKDDKGKKEKDKKDK